MDTALNLLNIFSASKSNISGIFASTMNTEVGQTLLPPATEPEQILVERYSAHIHIHMMENHHLMEMDNVIEINFGLLLQKLKPFKN